MVQIENAFITEGTSVYDFFQKPGVGLYIPLYQREYSWDNDNIDQLLDDIGKGVEFLVNEDDEIRFLGTIITVKENDPNNIQPLDRRGLPSTVELVIDGQQRLSTIALFSTVLYSALNKLISSLPAGNEDANEDIIEICESWKEKLLDVFSFDLRSGEPRRKPKIIRGSKDTWVKKGNSSEFYISEIANYLASFIEHVLLNKEEPKIERRTKVGKNLYAIKAWLEKTVQRAHIDRSEDSFPSANRILQGIKQDYLWRYDREGLTKIVVQTESNSSKSLGFILSSIVQTISVCYYLLDRCCFTSIQPINDKWAFDMFQSLNATGTPLTAIETFKPLVVNVTKHHEQKFKGSQAQEYFSLVEDLFKGTKSANKKNKLTNDFLASFSTTINGKAVSSHFSQQRKWLDITYNNTPYNIDKYQNQQKFLEYMGRYAQFFKDVWIEYSGKNKLPLRFLEGFHQSELASMLLLYLKDSNHKMSMTILAQYYYMITRKHSDNEKAKKDFISAVKAVSAFYTLWRSARSNSGLDNVYRQYFRGYESDGISISARSWEKSDGKISTDIIELKKYLSHVLEREDIGTEEKWKSKALKSANYIDAKKVCRFLLILSVHESMPDPQYSGLVKAAKGGTKKYLTLEDWISDDLKTIEHIAPQNGGAYWDENLYNEDELYQSVGNLTLLPLEVNSSAGNKSWQEKVIYYKHLSEQDPDKVIALQKEAEEKGINLSQNIIEKLRDAQYNSHILHIVKVHDEGIRWDKSLILARSERILSISYKRLIQWLDH
jgi:hypothetical protein